MWHNQCFKSWMNWAVTFCLSTIITWPPTNWSQLLQAFGQLCAGKTLLQIAGGRKCFLRVVDSYNTDFYATGIKKKKTFLIGKHVLIIVVPILIKKYMFDPSYNLKFMVGNHNYACTNLIWFSLKTSDVFLMWWFYLTLHLGISSKYYYISAVSIWIHSNIFGV